MNNDDLDDPIDHSQRAVFTFVDQHVQFHVAVFGVMRGEGVDPVHASRMLQDSFVDMALERSCWRAADYAAAFIQTNRDFDVNRLTMVAHWKDCKDLTFRYELRYVAECLRVAAYRGVKDEPFYVGGIDGLALMEG